MEHQPNYYSFPSGHIGTEIAAVTVIAENYPEVWWIRPLGYAGAACLASGLAGLQYHWWSDYPLGIALGYVFGMIAAHPVADAKVAARVPQRSAACKNLIRARASPRRRRGGIERGILREGIKYKV